MKVYPAQWARDGAIRSTLLMERKDFVPWIEANVAALKTYWEQEAGVRLAYVAAERVTDVKTIPVIGRADSPAALSLAWKGQPGELLAFAMSADRYDGILVSIERRDPPATLETTILFAGEEAPMAQPLPHGIAQTHSAPAPPTVEIRQTEPLTSRTRHPPPTTHVDLLGAAQPSYNPNKT